MPHLCEPSSPAASRVLAHSGTSNSSGAVAISKAARTAATQDVIMHVIPIAASDPTSLCFFVLVWLWLCVFGLLDFFCSVVVFWFLAGTARWTAYRSTTRLFGYRQVDSLA